MISEWEFDVSYKKQWNFKWLVTKFYLFRLITLIQRFSFEKTWKNWIISWFDRKIQFFERSGGTKSGTTGWWWYHPFAVPWFYRVFIGFLLLLVVLFVLVISFDCLGTTTAKSGFWSGGIVLLSPLFMVGTMVFSWYFYGIILDKLQLIRSRSSTFSLHTISSRRSSYDFNWQWTSFWIKF